MRVRLTGNRGLATLEMLIAMTIMVTAICSVLPLVVGGQSFSVSSQAGQENIYRNQTMLEEAEALARENFTNLKSQNGLLVTDVDSYTKKVSAGGLSTLVTDWKSALGGNMCSTALEGDWTQPKSYGYFNISNTAGASAVSIQGTAAYVVADSNSAATDDFYIIDVSGAKENGTSLPVLGHFSTTYGLTDVRTVGTYAYVVADSASYQFLVIDVADPAILNSSKVVAKRDMTASGDTAIGNTLFYADKKVYVGLTKSKGPEFYIFDVSNPVNPTLLGSYEVGGAVNDIIVNGSLAYLATSSGDETIALDVTNPASPSLVGTYHSNTLSGQSLAVSGQPTVYLGRIGGNGNPKLLAFSGNNLASPAWTMNMPKQSGVYSLTLRGNYLFLTNADPTDGFQIFDISQVPARYDTVPLNTQQYSPAGTFCFGNLLYVASHSTRALEIIGPHQP